MGSRDETRSGSCFLIAFRNLVASPVRTGIIGVIVADRLAPGGGGFLRSSTPSTRDADLDPGEPGRPPAGLQRPSRGPAGALRRAPGRVACSSPSRTSRGQGGPVQGPQREAAWCPWGSTRPWWRPATSSTSRWSGSATTCAGSRRASRLRRSRPRYGAHLAHVRRIVPLLKEDALPGPRHRGPGRPRRGGAQGGVGRPDPRGLGRVLGGLRPEPATPSWSSSRTRSPSSPSTTPSPSSATWGPTWTASSRRSRWPQIAEGQMIPRGQRGILVGKQYAEEWLKLKNARRLDRIQEARARGKTNRQGRGAAALGEGERVGDRARSSSSSTRSRPTRSPPCCASGLGAPAGEELRSSSPPQLFQTTDQDFDAKYRLFYDVVAPRIRLYSINVGDTITIKAPSKSGYFNSVNVKVYGFIQFRDIEKSGIAGMMSVMDLMSLPRPVRLHDPGEGRGDRAAQGGLGGAGPGARDEAEAALFGAKRRAPACQRGESRQTRIDEAKLLGSRSGSRPPRSWPPASTPRSEIEHGVALNAALILDDPGKPAPDAPGRAARLGRRRARPEGARLGDRPRGWWGSSSSCCACILAFARADPLRDRLVVINIAMVMATLQRVKEIGTMRAVGDAAAVRAAS